MVCAWVRMGKMVDIMASIWHEQSLLLKKYVMLCLVFIMLYESRTCVCLALNICYKCQNDDELEMALFGSELASWLPKSGISGSKKSSLDQDMGLCGSEWSLWLTDYGLVCTKEA